MTGAWTMMALWWACSSPSPSTVREPPTTTASGTPTTTPSTDDTDTDADSDSDTQTDDTQTDDTGSEPPPPPSPANVSVLAAGDFGSGLTAQFDVAAALTTWCAAHPCDGILGLGDNIYSYGVDSVSDSLFAERFEKPYGPLGVVWHLSLGNHDHLGDIGAQIAYSSKSAIWSMPAQWYGFELGGVAFFALDTVDRTDEQLLEMIQAIESSPADWKVAYGHYPLRSNGIHGDASGTQEDWMRLLLCHRVDLYFAGHDHNIQILEEDCGVGLVVSGAAGASTYSVDTEDNTIFALEDHGFVALDIDGDQAQLTAVDRNGKPLFTHTHTRRVIDHSCLADGFCDQVCASDPDCAGVSCAGDGVCEATCSDDPDCFGTCPCDYYGGICEAIEPDTTDKCGCDPTCAGDAESCGADDHCDTWCPEGTDPDC